MNSYFGSLLVFRQRDALMTGNARNSVLVPSDFGTRRPPSYYPHHSRPDSK